ncbi:helix-turn-helix domain-containing protein [uncultured Flavobacterium sp.]|uniref:helix-turn-helix domain-containing protein n=1 Tax=uncultured Flavobacterium sp. TaxID=165435 RepID=UPI0030C85306
MRYNDIYDMFFDYDDNLIIQAEIADFYVNKGVSEKNKIEIARGYYLFSLLDRKNDKIKSLSYLDSVIKYSYNQGDFFFPIIAYNEKAKLNTQLYEYEKTIINYLKAEKYAKDRDDYDNYYKTKYLIGVFKSEILGEVNEALDLYLEYKKYLKKKDLNDPYYSYSYKRLLFVLADAHKSIKNIDSSTYYNRLGYIISNKTNDEYTKNLFVLNEGANQVINNSFETALDSIKKGYPFMIKNKDNGNILASYYYFGRCYEGLGNEDLAIKYYKKVDSLYQTTKQIKPEFISGYNYLISYYKNKKDKTKQLEYLTTFMKIDSTLQKGYKKWNKLLKDKYDFPHLLEDKENLILELKRKKDNVYYLIICLLLVLFFVAFFGIRQSRLKSIYKERFESIVDSNNQENKNLEIEKNQNNVDIKNENLGISNEIIELILIELNKFEQNKNYLKANITINSLAQEFNSNSKYLSSIINTKKGKSFVNYINDLRIDYIVNELKINKNLRKYTIIAIAEETGFNTGESFSKAFFKRTGIKPSYFIKKLNEL